MFTIHKIFVILNCLIYSNCYILPQTFREWHCINFEKNINKLKPNVCNIGMLPLITWFDKDKPLSTINICSHMGSKLNYGSIINGTLICPLHKLSYCDKVSIGQTILYQNKLWWSYKPNTKYPPSIPLHNNNNYVTNTFNIDINTNFINIILYKFKNGSFKNNIYNY